MPQFSPFTGIRYDCDTVGADLGSLVAPPYDVIDEDERAALEALHERNAVRLILPRDDPPTDRYTRAAAAVQAWLRGGVLRRDPRPRYYSYRMAFADRSGRERHTHGVVGALALPEPGADDVLPHERTSAKAKSDRLALLRATRINADPIWGLTLGPGLTALLEPEAVLASCTDLDGVRHQLGALDDAGTIAAISAVVGAAPLVLADGHHRFETACTYRDELRAAGHAPGHEAAIMMLVVELVDEELCIEPIHRLVDVPAALDVRSRLADAFELRDAGPNTPDGVDELEREMRAAEGLGLVDGRGLALVVPRPDVRARALAGEHPAVAATDAAVVEAMVAPRLPGAGWHYRQDARAVAALVDKGAAGAAILCAPVSAAQTRAAALAGVRMPQKTTFFAPKPRTGMVFRALD